MQMSCISSVIDGTNLCLGIVWMQFGGTYQLNEGQWKNNKQQENKHEANCAGRLLLNINSNAW